MSFQTNHTVSDADDSFDPGSPEFFEDLVAAFWGDISRYFWVRVAVPDAQDLAQEVFLSVCRAVRNGRGPGTHDALSWRRYLFVAARSQLSEYRRRHAVSPVDRALEELTDGSWEERIAAPDDGGPAGHVLSDEEERAVHGCLSELEPTERAVCWLHFAQGRSKRRIAEALGMAESTLRGMMQRVFGQLRACLSGKGIRASEYGGAVSETRPGTDDDR